MPTNLISIDVTPEKTTTVQQLVENLQAELDFLKDLSVDDKKRLPKMTRRDVDIVIRGFDHAESRPQYLPSYVTIEEFKKDMDLAAWLRKLEKNLDLLSDKIKDTAMLAESEAYQAVRLYYNAVKVAARAGDEEAERIAKDLAQHYKILGMRKKETPAPPEPEQPQEPQQ